MPSFFRSEQQDSTLPLQSTKLTTPQGIEHSKWLFARELRLSFRLLLRFFSGFTLVVFLTAAQAQARRIYLISDEETESLMRDYAAPILKAGGLNPDDIRIHLVKDESLNAFVTEGNQMYIHTGLIINVEDPREVIGVMAHETGHIVGHHPIQREIMKEDSTLLALGSFLLGVGVGLASGDAGTTASVFLGGTGLAVHNQMSFARRQEAAADQAAVKFLTATRQSPEGLLNFMEAIKEEETLYGINPSPFLSTHPLTSQRMDFLRNQTAQSPYKNAGPDPDLVERHARVRAKLEAFFGNPNAILIKYPDDNQSDAARYARAIAYYRSAQQEKALRVLNELLANHPDDPYFLELKGQILFEFGQGHAAIPILEEAVGILPKANPIRYLLIQTLVEENTPESDVKALENIHHALRIQPNHSGLWRQAAIVYGRQDNKVLTSLALAESAFGGGKMGEAIHYGERVLKIAEPNSSPWLRASDLLSAARKKVK